MNPSEPFRLFTGKLTSTLCAPLVAATQLSLIVMQAATSSSHAPNVTLCSRTLKPAGISSSNQSYKGHQTIIEGSAEEMGTMMDEPEPERVKRGPKSLGGRFVYGSLTLRFRGSILIDRRKAVGT
jgi:hypothetical protein